MKLIKNNITIWLVTIIFISYISTVNIFNDITLDISVLYINVFIFLLFALTFSVGYISNRLSKPQYYALNIGHLLVSTIVLEILVYNLYSDLNTGNLIAILLGLLLANILGVYIHQYVIIKTPTMDIIDDERVNFLVDVLGGIDNINAIDVRTSRVKFNLNDVEAIDLEGLKELGTSGIFISGNSLQAIFGEQALLIVEKIKTNLK